LKSLDSVKFGDYTRSFQPPNTWAESYARTVSVEISGLFKHPLYEVLFKMLDRWNAHDIEGHLNVYWKSPRLLVVIDSEQFNGWQQLHDSYINGYPDRNAMGFLSPPDAASDRGLRPRPPQTASLRPTNAVS
jgi:hypothetical protein